MTEPKETTTMMTRLGRRWQLLGRNVIIPLRLERRFWRAVHAARHPVYQRKRRARPAIGAQCLAHAYSHSLLSMPKLTELLRGYL